MKKQGGQQRAAQKSDQVITVRLTLDERAKLDHIAITQGGTISKVIRNVINTAGDRADGAMSAAGAADIYGGANGKTP